MKYEITDSFIVFRGHKYGAGNILELDPKDFTRQEKKLFKNSCRIVEDKPKPEVAKARVNSGPLSLLGKKKAEVGKDAELEDESKADEKSKADAKINDN